MYISSVSSVTDRLKEANTCAAVCPEGAMKLANSFCDNAPGLFQVWYIRALFIKQQDLILSIEVTAYTSAGRPVRHVAGSGEVYMNFGTAMKISVVTLSAYRSSGSNVQIMMRVVSLEEELLDVHKECPLKSVLWTLRLVTAGARWPWLSSRPDQALRRPHGQFRGIGTGEYHMRRPTTSKLLLADFCGLQWALS